MVLLLCKCELKAADRWGGVWQVVGRGRRGCVSASGSEAVAGHTHQRLVHSPVESGHRVCPIFPVVAPADVRQSPLALKAPLRMRVVVLMIMRMMIVGLQVTPVMHIHADVLVVLLRAALSCHRPFPSCRQGPAFNRALAVDQTHVRPPAHTDGASRTIRVHATVAQGALLLTAAVQPAVWALCDLPAGNPPRAGGWSPVLQRGVTGRGTLAL